MRKIAFFHQNEVNGVQGGVERYLSTLLHCSPATSTLVTEMQSAKGPQRITVPLSDHLPLPKGMRYLFALFRNRKEVKRALSKNNVVALEFSRPELSLFAIFLDPRKTFTIHGPGPPKTNFLTYLIYQASCFVLPFVADLVQVMGNRNLEGLPSLVVKQLGTRIKFIDAWYDDAFELSEMPGIKNSIKIFYAGRLAPMKNPALLFDVVRATKQNREYAVEFRYFGSDDHVIKLAQLDGHIECFGLKTAAELSHEISKCHAGILCSTYGEGSPFIIVETLACGRLFIAPPLPILHDAYDHVSGVIFSTGWKIEDYLRAIHSLRASLTGGITARQIRAGVELRSKRVVSKLIMEQIFGDSPS